MGSNSALLCQGIISELDFRDLQASVADANMRCEQIDPVSAVLQPSCFSLHKHTFTSSSFVAAHPFLLQINWTFLFCSCAVCNIYSKVRFHLCEFLFGLLLTFSCCFQLRT